MRRLLSLLLSVAVLMGLAVSPAAAKKKPHEEFKDLEGAEWALRAVAEAQAKGLMKGTGDGKFDPNGSLTRAQAITVAIRLMGLEEEVKAAAATDPLLPFADVKAIADWAEPYVQVAVAKNILPVSEDGLLRPDEKASRLWVSVLLVRALGYDAEAQAKMAAQLPFKDARLIPATLVGYVAAAVDHELIKGYPDETFRPNQPLTRAQAATLLSRMDNQLAELGKMRPGTVHGELVSVDAQARTLVLKARGEQVQVAVAANAALFLGDNEATLANLSAGAIVTVVIGSEGTAVVVAARMPEQKENRREVKGTIAALLAPADSNAGLISLKLKERGEKTFPLATDVTVSGKGHSALTLADLKAGDRVEVKVVAGTVTSIKLEHKAEKEEKQEIEGTVTAAVYGTDTTLPSLTLNTESGSVTFQVAPGADIKLQGDRIAVTAIKVGDQVEAKVIGGVAVKIRVEREMTEVEGTVTQAVYGTSRTLTIDTESGSLTFDVATDAEISLKGRLITLAEILVGDTVEAKLSGEVASRIKVEREAIETEGTIKAVSAADSTITLTTEDGDRVLAIAPTAQLKYKGDAIAVADLMVGDEVEVKIEGGVVVKLHVEERGDDD